MRRHCALLAALLVLLLLAGSGTGGTYAPPPGDSVPTWSPDGSRIAFLTGRGSPSLAVVSATGSQETRLLDVPGVGSYPDPTSVALAPDWRSVATTRAVGRSLRLVAASLDGGGERDLGPVSYGAAPAWSPDSRRVAFRRADGSIVVAGIEGGPAQPVAPGGADFDWSPDGSRLAYAGGAPGDLDVHVVRSDGSGDVMLAGGPGAQLAPRWSPDGAQVAFLTQRATGEPFALSVMRADGTDLRVYGLPDRVSTDTFAWTPTGDALVSTRSAKLGIFRLDLATSEERRLTAFGRAPALSPDGSRLAFSGEGECRDRAGIYVTRASGFGARRLTNDCRILGTRRGDVIRGTPLADVLVGLAGDDRLLARDPGYVGDTLLGGDGDDVLLGAYRGDILRGGRGNDRLRGGNSQDVLVGGPGRDRLDGQRGADVVYARDGRRDTVTCGTNVRRSSRERDEVWVDALDLVAPDCEVVHRGR
jgi:Tol biopolymer transport system component